MAESRRDSTPGVTLLDVADLVVGNFTPVPRFNYRIGVPCAGMWREVLNSDARNYDGNGYDNLGGVEASPVPYHGRPYSLTLTLSPLAIVFFVSTVVE
jgi:1,4-alpha-glucan branching enzyme